MLLYRVHQQPTHAQLPNQTIDGHLVNCSSYDLFLPCMHGGGGGNEYGQSSHVHIFHFFEALNDAFQGHFFYSSGIHFYSILETLKTCRAMQLKILKVEILFIQFPMRRERLACPKKPPFPRRMPMFLVSSQMSIISSPGNGVLVS